MNDSNDQRLRDISRPAANVASDPVGVSRGTARQTINKFKEWAKRRGIADENGFKRAQRTFCHQESLSSAGGVL